MAARTRTTRQTTLRQVTEWSFPTTAKVHGWVCVNMRHRVVRVHALNATRSKHPPRRTHGQEINNQPFDQTKKKGHKLNTTSMQPMGSIKIGDPALIAGFITHSLMMSPAIPSPKLGLLSMARPRHRTCAVGVDSHTQHARAELSTRGN